MHRQRFYQLQPRQTALQENLTLLETTRKYRREVPRSLNRKMEIYSSKFLFNHVNGIGLVAYQAKKTKIPSCYLAPVMQIIDSYKLNKKQ